jgi:hypothetical protein
MEPPLLPGAVERTVVVKVKAGWTYAGIKMAV